MKTSPLRTPACLTECPSKKAGCMLEKSQFGDEDLGTSPKTACWWDGDDAPQKNTSR